MNACAKSASMITDSERFEEIFHKQAAIPDSEPGTGKQKTAEFLQSGRDELPARDERKETF